MAKFVLGGLGSSLSGKNGNVVYVRTANGIVVRNRQRTKNPRTIPQVDARTRMTKAVAAWSGLDPALAEAWRRYASSLAVIDPESGLPRAPKAMNVFTGLYAKLLQLDPSAVPPLPPGNPFFGDNVVVRVAPSSCAGDDSCPEHEEGVGGGAGSIGSPPPSPLLTCPAQTLWSTQGGGILFSADRPNSSGVVTELLLQRLPGRNCRSYRDKYRHQKFVAFTEGGLEATVLAEPGWYACGVRFVNTETGQDTPVVELGVIGIERFHDDATAQVSGL